MKPSFHADWPIWVRIEIGALLLTAMVVCQGAPPVELGVDRLAASWGMGPGAGHAVVDWLVLSVLMTGPCLGVLTMAVRVLRRPDGLALVSMLSVAVWAMLTLIMIADGQVSWLWAGDVRPAGWAAQMAVLAGSLAFLVHARPIWNGLNATSDAGASEASGVSEAEAGGVAVAAAPAVRSSWMVPVGMSLVFVVGLIAILAHESGGYGVNAATGDKVSMARVSAAQAPRVVARLPSVVEPAVVEPSVVQPAVVQLAARMPARMPDGANTIAAPVVRAMPNVVSLGGDAEAWRRGDGAFAFNAEVDDKSMRMMFDTGASRVTLRAEDAARLGYGPDRPFYTVRTSTANGISAVAPVVIGQITVGSITVRDVPAVVAMPGALRENLLGQSFLNRLRDYRVEGDRVVLHGR